MGARLLHVYEGIYQLHMKPYLTNRATKEKKILQTVSSMLWIQEACK